MHVARKRRRLGGGGALALGALLAVLLCPASASATAPQISAIFSREVSSRSARLGSEVNPQGATTTGYFEYATRAAYEAQGFSGAPRFNLSFGSGSSPITLTSSPITALLPATTYLYRLTVNSSGGQSVYPPAAPPRSFTTRPAAGGPLLADGRGWEMVSPVQKNGGQADPPESLARGGLIQAASGGGAITYSSASSFEGGQGAPVASQYLASRSSGGWTSQNLSVPIFSGSYDTKEGGAPYRLFSTDLTRALMLNGKSCRGEASEGCPVPNPPLGGTGAPAGFQDYYLRESATGAFASLLSGSEVSGLDPSEFSLRLLGASPDLRHTVLASCAALTLSATDGCPGQDNLYGWSEGGALTLLSSAPGATLAASQGAISADGSRVYLTQAGNLYLHEGATLKQADAGVGGGGTFQTASANGQIAYFTKASHLYRYASATNTATDLTPAGGVVGVLGAAEDGSHLYYLTGSGLYLCAGANAAASCEAAVKIAAGADPSDYPPASATVRVSADGTRLLFASSESLTGYDNTDLISGQPDPELYLYNASAAALSCLSCNPTGERPIGAATIPGAIANGAGPYATPTYRPRVLVDGGRRVFFDSADALAQTDTNSSTNGAGITDAYQWEAQGEGDCAQAGGCLALLSSGRSPGGARFLDASADGTDAFFDTDDSLIGTDPGALDVYDARVGGGFAEAVPPIPCAGDACQVLPPEPGDPTLTTLLSGAGNPPVHYSQYAKKKGKGKGKGHHHKKHKQKRRGRQR
jgi:hypothetical protein